MGNDRTFGLDDPSRSGKRQVRVIEVERLRVVGESGAAPRVGAKHVVRVEAGDAGRLPSEAAQPLVSNEPQAFLEECRPHP